MSPTRTSGAAGGSYRFDRVFEGVGRIQRSSGTDNKAEFRKRDVILTKLFENAQLETLRSFQRGDVTIEQLVEADRVGRLKSADLLSDMALRQPLWTAIDETLPRMGSSDETRRRYFTSLAKLQRLGRAGSRRRPVWATCPAWTGSSFPRSGPGARPTGTTSVARSRPSSPPSSATCITRSGER